MKNLIALMMISLLPCVASAAFMAEGGTGLITTSCFSVKKSKPVKFEWFAEGSRTQNNVHQVSLTTCKGGITKAIPVYVKKPGGIWSKDGAFKVKLPGKFRFLVITNTDYWIIEKVK